MQLQKGFLHPCLQERHLRAEGRLQAEGHLREGRLQAEGHLWEQEGHLEAEGAQTSIYSILPVFSTPSTATLGLLISEPGNKRTAAA